MLFRGRWLAGSIVVLVIAVVFVALGFWQLDRDQQKDDANAERRAAFAASAPELTSGSEPGERVEVEGKYDDSRQLLLRNRVRDGEGGYDVLTPLELDDGTGVVVDRGWVSRAAVTGGLDDLDPPAGPVVVRGLVRETRPIQPDDTVDERGGFQTVPRVDVVRLEEDLGYSLRTVWIEAQFQDPAPAPDDPALPEPPPFDRVNHGQYAFQWFAFAGIALIGWPIVLYTRARKQKPSPSRSE